VEESQSVLLARTLSRLGARVVAYDPLAGDTARAELHDQAVVLDSIPACLAQADVVLIATADPAFQALKASDFPGRPGGLTVVDFWRILGPELSGRPDIRYIAVGRCRDDAAAATRLAELWGG
jgi:UDP-glucose 6-dehydrogenase